MFEEPLERGLRSRPNTLTFYMSIPPTIYPVPPIPETPPPMLYPSLPSLMLTDWLFDLSNQIDQLLNQPLSPLPLFDSFVQPLYHPLMHLQNVYPPIPIDRFTQPIWHHPLFDIPNPNSHLPENSYLPIPIDPFTQPIWHHLLFDIPNPNSHLPENSTIFYMEHA